MAWCVAEKLTAARVWASEYRERCASSWCSWLAAIALSLCVGCHSGKANSGDTAGTPDGGGAGGAAGGRGSGTGDAGDGGAPPLAPWAAEDLGEGQCLAINGRGQVLGLDATGSPFVLAADGTRTNLGTMPDGSPVVGVALGATGDVVGFSESSTGRTAVRWTNGQWQALAGLSGTWSVAASVDDDGQIVGTTGSADAKKQAFLWKAGAAQPLPLTTAGSSSAFARVAKRVVGIMTVKDGSTHAFLVSTDGKLSDLGTLGGKGSNPFALNAKGTVVGAANDETQTVRAFSWHAGGQMRDLGLPHGAKASEARGVDANDRILGNVVDASGIARGVFFDTTDGEIENLPFPEDAGGASFVAARVLAMAADGRAVGTGTVTRATGNSVHCVLWRPE